MSNIFNQEQNQDFNFFSANIPENTSWPLSVQNILMACATLGSEENRKKMCMVLSLITLGAGTIALFSTAFTTCSNISLENKTSQTVNLNAVGPYKTKVSSYFLLPYSTVKIKLNGYNSYADLYTNVGQMHFSHFGTKGTLIDGAENRGIKTGSPPIFFWTCNQNYDYLSPSTNTTSSAAKLMVSIPYVDMVRDLFVGQDKAKYLRGSSLSSEETQVEGNSVYSNQINSFLFYKPVSKSQPTEQETASLLYNLTSA